MTKHEFIVQFVLARAKGGASETLMYKVVAEASRIWDEIQAVP